MHFFEQNIFWLKPYLCKEIVFFRVWGRGGSLSVTKENRGRGTDGNSCVWYWIIKLLQIYVRTCDRPQLGHDSITKFQFVLLSQQNCVDSQHNHQTSPASIADLLLKASYQIGGKEGRGHGRMVWINICQFKWTRRYSPLGGHSSSSCGGLWPRFFFPLGQKNLHF